jgi:superfamily II DNA/RNA helicase
MNIKQQGGPKGMFKRASPYVVILSPTRELAIQIKDTLDVFTQALGISSVCVYGGVPKWEQKKLLLENGGAEIVIATPGRFMDLLGFEWGSSTEINQETCCINLDRVGYFILDEADRMLDLGFQKDIKKIAEAMKQADKQTVMFRFVPYIF